MKFLANMGISPLTVRFLRDSGHDAIHLHEENLDMMPDDFVLEKAHRERRVLLTSDLDFSDLVAASGAKLPSVVIFRLKDMRSTNVNHHLEVILNNFLDALEEGVIVSVTEKRIRMRRLPVR